MVSSRFFVFKNDNEPHYSSDLIPNKFKCVRCMLSMFTRLLWWSNFNDGSYKPPR